MAHESRLRLAEHQRVAVGFASDLPEATVGQADEVLKTVR
jgi:hypothetical protein